MLELPEPEREAVLVAIAAGERTTEESGVVDAGLCHGAAGVGTPTTDSTGPPATRG